MRPRHLILLGAFAFLPACGDGSSRKPPRPDDQSPRIISLDFCADQYVLALAEREQIAGLSPDADKSFSYLRDQAEGLPKILPRAEDILVRNPDIVVRSYGGGPTMTRFLEESGVKLVQLPYGGDLDAVRQTLLTVGAALGANDKAADMAAHFDQRREALEDMGQTDETILYVTSKGAVAGPGTMISQLIDLSGRKNYTKTPGWSTLSLEALVRQSPDRVAAGFFDSAGASTDQWSPARHPVAGRFLANSARTDIPGAWTACNAWFIIEAAEALAAPSAGAAP